MNYLQIGNKAITTPLLTIVKDIKSQLRNGKLKVIKTQGSKNIRVTCPNRHHKGGMEHDADCDIYIGKNMKDDKGNIGLAYGTVRCFACGFSGPFYHFVAECFEISDDEAKNWLIENYYDGLVEVREELEPITLNLLDSSAPTITQSQIDVMQDWHPYMAQRKLTKEVCKEFEVKYEPSSKCVVFPVRDEKGVLQFCTRRSVETKKYIIDAGTNKPIYLLYYLKKRNIKEAYICESQINALTLWSHGLPGVALFGTGSTYQYDILNKSGITTFNLMFDGDAAGDKGIREFFKHIRNDVMVNVIKLPRGKDVNDLSYEELENLIENSNNDIIY